ncbi:hypothetical protein ACHAWF_017367 [Thalassiosira exigua]
MGELPLFASPTPNSIYYCGPTTLAIAIPALPAPRRPLVPAVGQASFDTIMGKRKSIDADAIDGDSIIAAIRASDNGKSIDLKLLRSKVLNESNLPSSGADEFDKAAKKQFKLAVKLLEKDERITLNADGVVKLSKSERSRESVTVEDDGLKRSGKKQKKDKKKERKRESKEDNRDNVDEEEKEQSDVEALDIGNSHDDNGTNTANESEQKDKNKPCKNNPQGITRLFLGNLPFKVDEPSLNAHFQYCMTHVKWITDKTTGRFYGSAFVEVRNSKDAANAMSNLNGKELMGRPIKINYAPVRPGEESDWPPRSREITGGKAANAGGGAPKREMSAKPEGCCKLFIGNLSYDIDDEAITKFFMKVEAELKAVRWLYHQDSGDFKGCGYAEFWKAEACDKAASLNGKDLLGRPIRIDWAE